MPYYVRKYGKEWIVCRNKKGKPGKIFGKHGNNKRKAEKQRRVLYMKANPSFECLSSAQRREIEKIVLETVDAEL